VVAVPGARPAQLRQVRERRLPVRNREAREAVLLESEVDVAGGGDGDRALDPLAPGPCRERLHRTTQRRQRLAGFQVRLGVGAAQVGKRVERPAVLDRREDVVELAVLGRRVVDGIRDDDRQAQVGRQGRRLGNEPVVVGQQVV
jgi:hypothetical protein